MLSVSDFVSKYQNYSDEELYDVHLNINGYSDEAKKALSIVLENKGGIDPLLKRLEEKRIVDNEIKRIKKETAELGSQGIDSSFIKATTTSDILSAEKVNEIIDNKYVEVETELADKKINPRTIVGSVIGGGIASLVGGILWGLQMIYSQRIFYMLFVGLILLCYGIIRLSTKQSKKNTVVVIATIASTILAVLIGQLLYEMIGYQS
ncbi:MAG: hypothetical protein ACM3H8_16395 [Sphingobacteriales bacterium]